MDQEPKQLAAKVLAAFTGSGSMFVNNLLGTMDEIEIGALAALGVDGAVYRGSDVQKVLDDHYDRLNPPEKVQEKGKAVVDLPVEVTEPFPLP